MSETGRRRGTRNATLFGVSITFMFFGAVDLRTGEFDPVRLFYLLLLFTVLLQAILFWIEAGELVVDTQQWGFAQLPPQLVAGLLIGLGVSAPLLAIGTRRVPEDLAEEFVTQVLYVAFVETVLMIVVLRTYRVADVDVGIYAWPFVFGGLHVLRAVLDGQVDAGTIARFSSTAIFGVLFEALYLARDAKFRGTWFGYEKKAFFGGVTVQIVHVVVNTVLVIAPVQMGAFTLLPLMTGLIG